MVQVSVTASVKVAGGPTVPLGTSLDPESYTYASVDLDVGSETAPVEAEIALLPEAGTAVLLALTAKTNGATPGTLATILVTLTDSPRPGRAGGYRADRRRHPVDRQS